MNANTPSQSLQPVRQSLSPAVKLVALYLLFFGGIGVLTRIIIPLIPPISPSVAGSSYWWIAFLYDLLKIITFIAGLALLCRLGWARFLGILVLLAMAFTGITQAITIAVDLPQFPYTVFRIAANALLEALLFGVMIFVLSTAAKRRQEDEPRAAATIPPELVLIGWFLLLHGGMRIIAYLGKIFADPSWTTKVSTQSQLITYLLLAWSVLLIVVAISLLSRVRWARVGAILALYVLLIGKIAGLYRLADFSRYSPKDVIIGSVSIICWIIFFAVMIRLISSAQVTAAIAPESATPAPEDQPATQAPV